MLQQQEPKVYLYLLHCLWLITLIMISYSKPTFISETEVTDLFLLGGLYSSNLRTSHPPSQFATAENNVSRARTQHPAEKRRPNLTNVCVGSER